MSNKINFPFVSLCTPTFNRRPFIPYAIKCFLHQDYPKECIEWIIVDDGTDKVEDLFIDMPGVKYFFSEDKMLLGKKRNFMHSKCSGDIIIYMDDDDYYPPTRISHAVQTLLNNPEYLIAGSSEMHIYFESLKSVYQCGPYKQNHSTAATFAFRKELLKQTKFEDKDSMSEEFKFLKGYTIPLIQLDPIQTILVFSHNHNSLNKEKLLEKPEQFKIKLSSYNVSDFIKEPELENFYKYNMNNLLEHYEPGRPENKPIILSDIKKAEEKREQKLKEIAERQKIIDSLKNIGNETQKEKISTDISQLKKSYEKKLEDKNLLINELFKKVRLLTEENNALKNKLQEMT
jgi:glycosyltransferase involved in cell wall biosynthesis